MTKQDMLAQNIGDVTVITTNSDLHIPTLHTKA